MDFYGALLSDEGGQWLVIWVNSELIKQRKKHDENKTSINGININEHKSMKLTDFQSWARFHGKMERKIENNENQSGDNKIKHSQAVFRRWSIQLLSGRIITLMGEMNSSWTKLLNKFTWNTHRLQTYFLKEATFFHLPWAWNDINEILISTDQNADNIRPYSKPSKHGLARTSFWVFENDRFYSHIEQGIFALYVLIW